MFAISHQNYADILFSHINAIGQSLVSTTAGAAVNVWKVIYSEN